MDDALPPFHVPGDDADFYALAYCAGEYVSPSGSQRDDAYVVLYYSPSPGLTRLSFHSWTRDGRHVAYARGVDAHDTAEFALLTAWYEFELPPHLWRLYPADSAEQHWAGQTNAHAAGYADVRECLASILHYLRWKAWSREGMGVAPLLTPTGQQGAPNPLEESAENAEIFRAAAARLPDRDEA